MGRSSDPNYRGRMGRATVRKPPRVMVIYKDGQRPLYNRRYPSSKQLLACARILLSEVAERTNKTYSGDGCVESLIECVDDTLHQIDAFFRRHNKTRWAQMHAADPHRQAWESPEILAAYRWRRSHYRHAPPGRNRTDEAA